MRVKIKRLSEDAVLPQYMKSGDAAMDLVATSREYDSNGCVVYGTSLAFEIPMDHVGLIFPRSSNAGKDLILSNSIGVIDSGYRGEVKLKYKPSGFFATDLPEDQPSNDTDTYDYICFPKEAPDDPQWADIYSVGDRIGQIMIIPRPRIVWEEVFDLSATDRGEGGYGSTNVTSTGTFEGPTNM